MFAFTLLMVVPLITGQKRESCPEGTLYSLKATTLGSADQSSVQLTSPDGRKTLVMSPDESDPQQSRMRYVVEIAGKTFEATLLGFDGEVEWSPDSTAFAVTETEGGGSLGSRVYVFYVTERGMKKFDVSKPVERDFGNPVKCQVPVSPNSGFITWTGDSSRLLVAAEVVPIGGLCQCSGTFRVYEIDVRNLTIVRTYSQAEAKKQYWDVMGCELRQAPEGCVKDLERHKHQPGRPTGN